MSARPEGMRARVGDEAVRAATGKSWPEWFATLDAAGAASMSHREIAALLATPPGVGPWWQQMVTVGYEQARGLRAKHEKADGFAVSASRTIGVTVERAFAAWCDDGQRAAWLAEPITIRRATPHKSLRITWADGTSNVEVNLTPKGDARCQVAVEHGRLPDAEAAARMKEFWKGAVTRLKTVLEG